MWSLWSPLWPANVGKSTLFKPHYRLAAAPCAPRSITRRPGSMVKPPGRAVAAIVKQAGIVPMTRDFSRKIFRQARFALKVLGIVAGSRCEDRVGRSRQELERLGAVWAATFSGR